MDLSITISFGCFVLCVLVKHFWWGPDLGHNNFVILKAIIEVREIFKKQNKTKQSKIKQNKKHLFKSVTEKR